MASNNEILAIGKREILKVEPSGLGRSVIAEDSNGRYGKFTMRGARYIDDAVGDELAAWSNSLLAPYLYGKGEFYFTLRNKQDPNDPKVRTYLAKLSKTENKVLSLGIISPKDLGFIWLHSKKSASCIPVLYFAGSEGDFPSMMRMDTLSEFDLPFAQHEFKFSNKQGLEGALIETQLSHEDLRERKGIDMAMMLDSIDVLSEANSLRCPVSALLDVGQEIVGINGLIKD